MCSGTNAPYIQIANWGPLGDISLDYLFYPAPKVEEVQIIDCDIDTFREIVNEVVRNAVCTPNKITVRCKRDQCYQAFDNPDEITEIIFDCY
jgi:hypothetical protein